MKKNKKIISILFLIIILFSNSLNLFAKTIANSEKINLKYDHDCISVLQIKGKDILKQVAYVCYQDPDTGIKYPAFCVEPSNKGIGTGAGDSYDVTISKLNNPALWRILYKGYVGTNYKNWGLNCDDDLYFATKTAVHCFVDNVAPVEKYEVPKRVGRGDNVSLDEVKQRGAKVLDVAQKIYEYGINSSENYIKATVKISKSTSSEITLNNKKYLVQNYNVSANKELSSYDVSISNFPNGTKILNLNNIENKTMKSKEFKIAIPEDLILENFTGNINVNNAKVKSYPIFYASSGNPSTQDYVISDFSEITQANTTLTIDAYKSTLKIVKTDDEKNPVANVTFNFKYKDGVNIGDFTTDRNGTIIIKNLKQGRVVVTEKKVDDKYILNSKSENIDLEYNKTSALNVINKFKKGNLRIIKVDKDDNDIKIPNVQFDLLDSNKKGIGKYTTDNNGEIYIKDLKIGKYYLRETKENELYYPLKEDMEITIDYNKDATKIIENELKKGQIRVIKVDKDNNEIKLEGVEFEVLDEENNILETIVTDDKGEALTKEYPIRNFKKLKIREKNTLEEYVLSEEIVEVELDEKLIKEVIFENEKIKIPKLELPKVPELPKLPRTGF